MQRVVTAPSDPAANLFIVCGSFASANHTCCKRHQNVELQFITVQAMQEDEDSNALTTVKPVVAAVLQAKREIQPGEFIRYQYTDQSEHLKKDL